VPEKIAEKKRKTAETSALHKKKLKTVPVESDAQLSGEDNSSPEPSPAIKITAYIDVVITQPAQGCKQGSSGAISRGPFFFFDHTDFPSFQAMVAKTLPCLLSSLSWTKIMWKFDTPANSHPKNLSDDVGYEVLISGVVERKKNYVVQILTPPPSKSETI